MEGRAQADSLTSNPVSRQFLKEESFQPELRAMLQFWSAYTIGEKLFDESSQAFRAVDGYLSFYLRRARLSLKGKPYKNLKYSIVFSFDQVGGDLLSNSVGATKPSGPAVGLRDAFLQWKLSQNELAHLTGGWFSPQVYRENISSAWSVNSFEKAVSANYVRAHLTDLKSGRAPGLNLGGLTAWEAEGMGKLALNYNLGIFTPTLAGSSIGTSRLKLSPLIAGRVSLSLGEPEMNAYSLSYKENYFGRRRGCSLDFNFSRQGKNNLFESSRAFGPGILVNVGSFNFSGEWAWQFRSGYRTTGANERRDFTASAATGYLRSGFNFPAGRFVLAPTIMLAHFRGALDAVAQADAEAVRMASGRDTALDFGFNWYLQENRLRLLLHYTWRKGDAGAAPNEAAVNLYFIQSDAGVIHRGDWLGLGLNALF